MRLLEQDPDALCRICGEEMIEVDDIFAGLLLVCPECGEESPPEPPEMIEDAA